MLHPFIFKMTTNKITYGNGIFNLNFNLYGYDNIEFEQSKEDILEGFKKQYEKALIKVLSRIGLKYCGLNYHSPKAYNYEGDNLDLIISVINKDKFKKEILKFKGDIQAELNKNKSYDGYMSLTISDIKEELENLKNSNYEPDILVLSTTLSKNIDFKDFDINDYVVFEDLEEEING